MLWRRRNSARAAGSRARARVMIESMALLVVSGLVFMVLILVGGGSVAACASLLLQVRVQLDVRARRGSPTGGEPHDVACSTAASGGIALASSLSSLAGALRGDTR